MKTTRYRFEQAVQEVKPSNQEWLKDEFKTILESEKDYTRKCDYIGFSISSIDEKVASLDEEMKELQELKKHLKSAKEIALTVGAQLFSEYGIDKLEGAGISSITLSKPSTKIKSSLTILNEEMLINKGYFKLILDEEAIIKAFSDPLDKYVIEKYCTLVEEQITTPAKIKINKRRQQSAYLALEVLDDECCA